MAALDTCGLWLSGDRGNLSVEKWPRFVAVIRQAAVAGIRDVAVNVSASPDNLKAHVEHLLADLPPLCPTCAQHWIGGISPRLRIGIVTAEAFGGRPLDGDRTDWDALADLANWCYTKTGQCPLIDCEWSLQHTGPDRDLDWLEGTPGATLDLARFADNLLEFAAFCGVPEVYVYPSQWRGVEARRMAFLAAVARALGNRMRLIGTSWHSPGSMQHAGAPLVREIDAALSLPAAPVEQIIVGPPHWWLPETLATPLKALPAGRRPWVWFQTDVVNVDPQVNLVAATLAAAQAALAAVPDARGT